jgi:hypothetical protein
MLQFSKKTEASPYHRERGIREVRSLFLYEGSLYALAALSYMTCRLKCKRPIESDLVGLPFVRISSRLHTHWQRGRGSTIVDTGGSPRRNRGGIPFLKAQNQYRALHRNL